MPRSMDHGHFQFRVPCANKIQKMKEANDNNRELVSVDSPKIVDPFPFNRYPAGRVGSLM